MIRLAGSRRPTTRFPGSAGIFVVGRDDEVYRPQAELVTAAARVRTRHRGIRRPGQRDARGSPSTVRLDDGGGFHGHRVPPTETTQDWRQPPDPRPESVLVGGYYSCFPGRADLVASDAGNWLLAGIVHNGEHLAGVVGVEYSKVNLSAPTPRPIEVLFHSPVVCGTTKRREFSDVTYYTTRSGAGVFSSGTQDWVCGMDPACRGKGRVGQVLDAVSTRLLQQFAAGPAGTAHPAVDNLVRLGINQIGAVPPPPDND